MMESSKNSQQIAADKIVANMSKESSSICGGQTNDGGDRQVSNNNKQRTNGRITLKLDHFSQFVLGSEKKLSEQIVVVQGLRWVIIVQPVCENDNIKFLKYGVLCLDTELQKCNAMIHYRIRAVNDDKADRVNGPLLCNFRIGQNFWFYSTRIDYILDPENGLLDVQNDTITIEADVFADRPLAKVGHHKTEILIVNGKHRVSVDKYHLADHSDHFKKLFFEDDGGNNNGVERHIHIDESVASFADFDRMIECTYPDSEEALNDDCIEGVLNVANQFLVDSVEHICTEYLQEKSEKCALSKYRLAEHYGLGALKESSLQKLVKEQLDGKKLVDYTKELAKMDDQARREFAELLECAQQAPTGRRPLID